MIHHWWTYTNEILVYDQDIGYVQGMSDIGVVILDLYEQDHVAFWIFTKFMQRVRGNFEKSQKAMKETVVRHFKFDSKIDVFMTSKW